MNPDAREICKALGGHWYGPYVRIMDCPPGRDWNDVWTEETAA